MLSAVDQAPKFVVGDFPGDFALCPDDALAGGFTRGFTESLLSGFIGGFDGTLVEQKIVNTKRQRQTKKDVNVNCWQCGISEG